MQSEDTTPSATPVSDSIVNIGFVAGVYATMGQIFNLIRNKEVPIHRRVDPLFASLIAGVSISEILKNGSLSKNILKGHAEKISGERKQLLLKRADNTSDKPVIGK